ncbi:hypothetical protein OAK64_02390 [Deltaproteobacteria bacterium]|nr:hypothetical protein [Deltaproteobacteria bacterium]|tara:strand:+ start:1940 stop:2836 length:897 start_codon:yes stop_codon:yes gene_type:complete
MKSLTDYTKFFSSIEDPLERLDGIEVLLEDLENPLTEIQGYYEMGSISSEEYETESQKIDSCFRWGNDEISSIKDLHSDLIEERSKNSWSGHNRLKFPVVWNRDSYNNIEPEIRTAGRKGEWIEWLLGNLTEGKDKYWTYEDRILNAAQLDLHYYLDFLGTSFSIYHSCTEIGNNFVVFLFNVQKLLALKKNPSKSLTRPNNPFKKEYNEMEKLILRTMQNRKKDNKKWEWSFVLRDLQKNTHEGQIVNIKDIPASDDTMQPGISLYEKGLSDPTHQLLQSTFKKKLTTFRKLLSRKN